MLTKNKKNKKNGDGESVGYSYVKWSEVASVLERCLKPYSQDVKEVPEKEIDSLHEYLSGLHKTLGRISGGKEAKRLCYIFPIIQCVCLLFDGEVMILVEEDVNGIRLNVNGRFEYVLQRGGKRVCIVEAKKDDMDQGNAQNLLGCEAVADVEGLSCVYGISTTYTQWSFFRSLDDTIQEEECSLEMESGLPTKQSLAKIAGKIYSMLAEDE